MVQEVVNLGNEEELSHHQLNGKPRERSWKSDVRIISRSGEERWISDTSVELPGEHEGADGSLGILQDITEQKRYEKALLHDTLHDALTGLPNRVLILEHLRLALHRIHRRSQYRFAILFLDLDGFKPINDSLGHLAGDEMLKTIAGRLVRCVRPADTVARFAGDEFVILLDDIQRPADVIPMAERILHELKQPVALDGHEVSCGASMGIVTSSISCGLPEDMLRDADTALYQAKANGRGRYEIFNAQI